MNEDIKKVVEEGKQKLDEFLDKLTAKDHEAIARIDENVQYIRTYLEKWEPEAPQITTVPVDAAQPTLTD